MKNLIHAYKNLKSLVDNPIRFLDDKASSGPEIQRVSISPKSFVLVFCADTAREILVGKSASFVQNRSIFDKIKPLTGDNGLVQLQGKASKIARAGARSMFSRQAIERSTAIIENNCDLHFSKINDDIEPSKVMTDLVLENALEIFLGVVDKKSQKIMGQTFLKLHELCGQRMLNPFTLPLSVPLKKNNEIKALSKKLEQMVLDHLSTSSHFPEGSIPFAFKDNPNLVDHCMTFLFAGHETTASSLAFSLLLLSQTHDGQRMIRQGGDQEALSAYKESLRLYPPAYMLVRETTEDIELGNTNFNKGDQIIIGLKQILASESYFSKPNQFLANRFVNKDSEKNKAFFPFGLGGKSCLGEQLAYLEAKLVLKSFFKRFEIVVERRNIASKPMVTLHPSPGQSIRVKRISTC